MAQAYPKRLIEVDLPIARISAHARREKSIRHGHISTLHIWWARRALAACRAVICAALWPDPVDPLCPPAFREAAVAALTGFAKRVNPERITEEKRQLQETLSEESRGRWEALAAGTLTLDPAEEADWFVLRMALLDFIADFANWDNSTVPAYLETSRALTQAAHEALGGVPGTRPLVVDPFAGGGSIPLEALRVGADAFASDLNPVAVLLNKVVLEYIPKYGNAEIRMPNAEGQEVVFHGLAEAVRYWGNWVKEQAERELAEFYPKDPDGGTPIAYLWARTILSEAPGQGDLPVEVPLIRSLWLCKKPNRKVALRWVRDKKGVVQTETVEVSYADGVTRSVRRPLLEIFEPESDNKVEGGTVARGSATCPVTGYTTPVSSVRSQIKRRTGGAGDSRLLAAVVDSKSEDNRQYRLPVERDLTALQSAATEAQQRRQDRIGEFSLIPEEPTPLGGGRGAGRAFSQRIYGMERFSDLFTPRQLVSLSTLVRLVRRATESILDDRRDSEIAAAVGATLGFCASKLADLLNSLCGWQPTNNRATHLFARQAIQITWDYAESTGAADAVGNFGVSINNIARIFDREAGCFAGGQTSQASATQSPLPDDSVDAVVTDPPYYDAVPYADLSDFFFVWLKRAIVVEGLLPRLETTPKELECIVDDAKGKDAGFFLSSMMAAMKESRRVTRPSGISVVVFAHKSTAGWETQLQALIEAGWVITGSWPIDTEWGTRLRAMNSAALASSVHLVCRPREDADGNLTESVGEWRDVLGELPKRIHEWMPRLAAEGVVGADAIFACLGPALEIFSRYSRVEKANGEPATLREYLEHVWAAVSTEALALIFREADASGLEPDARLTAMWLWTLGGADSGGRKAESQNDDDAEDSDDDGEPGASATGGRGGFTLEYDAARKIAQGLGVHLEQCDSLVEVKGDKARLLPVSERTQHLFGKGTQAATSTTGRRRTAQQRSLFQELGEAEADEAGWTAIKGPSPGSTVLDRVHQSMILFAANRGELLKRFLVEDGVGKDARFWKLADNLNKLYPAGTEERRWVEGVLARKKGLGL